MVMLISDSEKATMGDDSFVIEQHKHLKRLSAFTELSGEGIGNPDSFQFCSHGAGRAMRVSKNVPKGMNKRLYGHPHLRDGAAIHTHIKQNAI